MLETIIAAVLALFIVLTIGPVTISSLRRLKFGQSVREEGPKEHLKKSGVPTMGGILIVLGMTVAAVLVTRGRGLLPWALFVTGGHFVVGLIDDLIIVVRRRSLGLKARHKLLWQAVFGLIIAALAAYHPDLGPALLVPGTRVVITLPPWLYIAFGTFWVVGFSNAVNLTDGLDGLAAGTVTLVAVAYAIIALAAGQPELAVLAGAIAGACLGFVWFNAPPAQIFMGDTGSLALGAALAGLSILTKTELFLAVLGGIFVIETLSVMIQVVSFRLTGRRVFKMSPVHHHFELSGWPETKVVARFWLVGLLFALVGLLLVPAVNQGIMGL